MRSTKKIVIGLAAALVVAAIPSFAGASARQGNSGTWTFTDVTANPTVFGECSNSNVPSAPGDVNAYEIKVKKKTQTLQTVSHNQLDWAAEVRDSQGNVIASSDQPFGGSQAENFNLPLRKGTYTVYYCNWSGEPQITVDWSLK